MVQQQSETKENKVGRYVLEALTSHNVTFDNLKSFFEKHHPDVADLRRLYDMKQVLKATHIIDSSKEGVCYQACVTQPALLGETVLRHLEPARRDLVGAMRSLKTYHIPENILGRKADGQLPALAVIAKLVMLALLAQPADAALPLLPARGIMSSTFIKLIHAAFSDEEGGGGEDEQVTPKSPQKKTKPTYSNSARARNQRQVYLVLNMLVMLKILVGPDAACKRSTQAYTLAPPLYHATGRYYFGNVLDPSLPSSVVTGDLLPTAPQPKQPKQQQQTAGEKRKRAPEQQQSVVEGERRGGRKGRRLVRRCAQADKPPPPPAVPMMSPAVDMSSIDCEGTARVQVLGGGGGADTSPMPSPITAPTTPIIDSGDCSSSNSSSSSSDDDFSDVDDTSWTGGEMGRLEPEITAAAVDAAAEAQAAASEEDWWYKTGTRRTALFDEKAWTGGGEQLVVAGIKSTPFLPTATLFDPLPDVDHNLSIMFEEEDHQQLLDQGLTFWFPSSEYEAIKIDTF